MKTLSVILLLAVSCTKYYDPRTPLPENQEEAISSSFRSEENVDRDEYQHPKETLEFFGIKPNMTVVEVSPGDGYFTEILGPYLSKEGQLILAVPRMNKRSSRILIENEKKLQDILLRNNYVQARTKLMPFEPLNKKRDQFHFADAVVSFNNVHNWVARKSASEAFKFFHDVLKPGGTLGIVQHRIHEGKTRVPKSGYMYEREVIALAKAAGLKLVKKSEINANPKDTADHPGGVWTLPPTYRLGEKDRDKYEEIGESDRMTMKFIKLP